MLETYFNYINDFIAADRDGSTVDVEGEDFNNVVHYQYDAIFTGIELSGQYNFAQYQNFDFLTNFMVDFLKGYRPRDSLNDKAISRIPQSKVNVGLQAKNDNWDAELTYNHYFDKDFLGPFQTRTGGHSRLDFNLTKDFSYSNVSGHLMFGAKNILDVVGRNHLESKKSQVQLPGRSFIFMVKVFY